MAEPKLGWRTVGLDDPHVVDHLTHELTRCYRPTVMLDSEHRWGRSHLRLHKDRGGYFVRVGKRGANKEYLGKCKLTLFDGVPTLFSFTLASTDAFNADQERRWCVANGIDPDV